MTNARVLWVSSALTSALLLGAVVAQIEWASAREVIGRINTAWIAAAILCQIVEGTITAARIQLMTRTHAAYRQCLTATAWYVVMLIALPARLGEVAGVGLIVRYTRESSGAAAAGLLFQRLFDIAVLLTLTLGLTALMWRGEHGTMLLTASALMFLLFGFVYFLEDFLALAARPCGMRPRGGWRRRIVRFLLQARMLRRHHMTAARTSRLAVLTLAKTAASLGAVACAVVAIAPEMPVLNGLALGVVYHLSAAVPLQTVGGFGVTEAVLLGSLNWLGYTLALGATIAIVTRIVLIAGPVLFWLLVLTGSAVIGVNKETNDRKAI